MEVDTQPPSGFTTEYKTLMLPFSCMVRCYSLSDLYAGKMHALLFRKWKNRVKGRDWYDFEWYIRNQIAINFTHLQKRVEQMNGLTEKEFTPLAFKEMLKERIVKTDIELVKDDTRSFLINLREIEIWSTDYFLQLVDMIRFK